MVRIDKVDNTSKVVTSELGVELLSEALQLSKEAAKAQYTKPYEGKWLKHAKAKIRYLEILDEVRQMERIRKYEKDGWGWNEEQPMVEIDGKAYCFTDSNFGCWCSKDFMLSEYKEELNMEFDEDYIWR